MAKIEVELDDKGEFLGQIPPELDAILKRTDAAAHGRGYQKAAEEARPQIADGIKQGVEREINRLNVELPIERERFRQAQDDLKGLQAKYLEAERDAAKNLHIREEQHAQEIVKRSEALKKRDAKIKALVQQTLQVEAIRAGAADNMVEHVQKIIADAIGYNDEMEPFVKDEDGREKLVHGKPVSIAQYMKDFLDSNPGFRKPVGARPGNARGGATFSQPGSGSPDVATARARVESGDRSPDAINDLFEATRKRAG